MQNTIDFRELRRQERQRIRSSKDESNGKDCANGDAPRNLSSKEVKVEGGGESLNQHSNNVCASNTSSPSLSPYESLLHKNQLSKDIYRIVSPSTIDSVFYAKDFLSPAQTHEITSWLQSIPEYSLNDGVTDGIRQTEREESRQHNGKWTRLKHAKRKVALFDGTICNLPPILQRLSNTLVAIDAFPPSHPPNHVLINEYQPGEGIMPHTDGPAYESRTATISLGGSDVIFKLWRRQQHHDNDTGKSQTSIQPAENEPSLEVILHGNGSLVLFTDDAYLNHCHEIREGIFEETTSSNGVCGNDVNGGMLVKRGYRISFTFRCKI